MGDECLCGDNNSISVEYMCCYCVKGWEKGDTRYVVNKKNKKKYTLFNCCIRDKIIIVIVLVLSWVLLSLMKR